MTFLGGSLPTPDTWPIYLLQMDTLPFAQTSCWKRAVEPFRRLVKISRLVERQKCNQYKQRSGCCVEVPEGKSVVPSR
uniref:Uncharacterized protein n=1 Tax=Anguilla anguilla TaxID=7936 RepID=A0A0E9RAL3_ANGAN